METTNRIDDLNRRLTLAKKFQCHEAVLDGRLFLKGKNTQQNLIR